MPLIYEDLTDVFESYLQSLGVGFLLYDHSNNEIRHTNDQLQLLLGYSSHELTGVGIDMLRFSTNSQLGDPVEIDLSNALFNDDGRTQFRGHCVRKNGDTVPVQLEVNQATKVDNCNVVFVREIDEPLNLWQSNVERANDLRPTEAAQAKSESFDSVFFEKNQIPFIICNGEDRILKRNDAVQKLLGNPPCSPADNGFDLIAFAPYNSRSLVALLNDHPKLHLALRKHDGKAVIVEAQVRRLAQNDDDQFAICFVEVPESQLSLVKEPHLHPLQKSATGEDYFMLKLNDKFEIMFGNKACWDCIHEMAEAKHPAKLRFEELLPDPEDVKTIMNVLRDLREEKLADATVSLKMFTPTNGEKKILWNISCMWSTQLTSPRYVLVGLLATNSLESKELSQLISYRRETESHHERVTLQSLIEGQEQERSHISQELHDSLGQILVASRRTLSQHIRKQSNPDLTSLQNLKSNLDEAITEVRRISHGLATGVLQDHGLVAALENMLTQFTNTDIDVSFTPKVTTQKSFGSAVETAFYRIGQEVCTNALKHSSCSEISLEIDYSDNLLKMIVRDNGVGMLPEDKQAESKGTGLRNLHSRAYLIGAKIALKSDANSGTTFTITYALN